jgi:hypothetical protein
MIRAATGRLVLAPQGSFPMSTRSHMRRELQDLARLAGSMPKEQPTPSSAGAMAVAAASDRPTRPEGLEMARPTAPSSGSMRILASVATVPPPAFPVSAATAAKSGASPRQHRRGRGSLVMVASFGLVVAIAGGGLLGRSLANRAGASGAAAAPPAPVAAQVVAPVVAPVDPPAPPQAPVVAAAATPPTTPAHAASSPARPTAAAAWHRPTRTVAKPATAAAGAPVAVAAATPAPAPASAPKDSLDELIRKAVASPSK